jgi:beta-galactosidase
VGHWRERLDTRAQVVIEDEEDFPVLVAQGKLHYLAASGDWALMQRIVDHLLAEADVPTLTLPAGVRCRTRGNWRVYFNYGDTAANLVPAPDEKGYVLGTAQIEAAGVTVARLATDA